MTDNTISPNIHVEESEPAVDSTHALTDHPPAKARRSSIEKIISAVKKPFQHEKKEKDIPPALQDAIDKMEARKRATVAKMEGEGKDTNVPSELKDNAEAPGGLK